MLTVHNSIFSNDFVVVFFFFNDTATTEIYTLSLHDALPISHPPRRARRQARCRRHRARGAVADRKSTRLNSSHSQNLVCRLLLEKKKKYLIKQYMAQSSP